MSTHDEMTCKELVEVVSDLLDGTLAIPDRVRLEEHLEECPYCVEYVEQMRRTIGALGELTDESIAPQTREKLVEAFRGWRSR